MSTRKTILFLLFVVFISPIVSCTRLPEAPDQAKGTLRTEKLPALDSVPLAWGNLSAVTTSPEHPKWFQLWFQDESGNIRMVAFKLENRTLSSNAVSIPRK